MRMCLSSLARQLCVNGEGEGGMGRTEEDLFPLGARRRGEREGRKDNNTRSALCKPVGGWGRTVSSMEMAKEPSYHNQVRWK
jgi:hypothetical protein